MFERLLYFIRQQIDAEKDSLVEGRCPSHLSYMVTVERIQTLRWVIEQIDKLNRADDNEDATFGSVEEFDSATSE
jgi:hypothetical protein